MKNTFFILVTGLLMSFSVHAQKKKASPAKQVNVPENVNASFKNLYTTADGSKWNKNYSGNYVVTFLNAEHLEQTAEFSESGAMIKSSTEYAPDALPQGISSSISTQYPNSKLTAAAKLQMPGVAPYYKAKIVTADNITKELLISEEGTITE